MSTPSLSWGDMTISTYERERRHSTTQPTQPNDFIGEFTQPSTQPLSHAFIGKILFLKSTPNNVNKMGITNFDMKNQAVQSRIAKALERIADAMEKENEKKTCNTSTDKSA